MTEKLRILVVDEGVLGGRTLMAQLRSAFDADPGVEATFVTVPPPNRLERLLLRRVGSLGDADLSSLRWRLRWSWRTRRIIKRHAADVDVAFVNTQASALLARRPMKRTPSVLSIDATARQYVALEYEGEPDRWSPLQTRILVALERRAVRSCARAMAWSRWAADGLREEGIEGEKIATLHPGLDAEWWTRVAARRREGDGGPLRVLFVGNDVERKGLAELRAAVEALGGRAVLDVVTGASAGETPLVRVHHGITAHSEALAEMYASADVFALPTRADASPWVVLEALAAGVPVLASRVGAIEEMVGDAGILVAPGDQEALVAALERLVDPKVRADLSSHAAARVAGAYDSATQTGRMIELMRDVVEEHSGAGQRRFRRRTVIGLGAGAVGVAVIAPYLPLLTDDEFADLVGSRLGIDKDLAADLLGAVRDQYGTASYDAHAAAFALAVRNPAAAVMPESLRRKAIDGIVEPLLSAPSATLAFAVTGVAAPSPACAGLVRDS